MKKMLSLLLSTIMAVTILFSDLTPLGVQAADSTDTTNYLTNASFEDDIWGDNPSWTITVADWSGLQLQYSNQQIKDGDHSFHYYAETANEPIISQTLSLKAGTYTLSGYFSGDSLSTPKLYASASESGLDQEASVSLTGWGTFDEGQLEFTIEKDCDVTVGVKISCQNGGWGDIDAMSLVEGEADTPAPEPAVKKTVTVKAINGMASNFAMGVDVSSVLSEEAAGVQFKNTDGEVEDFFKILKDAGVNYIRVRIWNDPHDSEGHSYGGGNTDLENAKEIARRAAKYNMKMLVDFHYSDFWASPTVQDVPKAWKGKTVAQKASLISSFTKNSLKELKNCGAKIGMVQIGNETSAVFCGESNWKNICTMMKSGCNAVKSFDSNIKTMIHFGGSSKNVYIKYAEYLKKYSVPYDILGISWYPFYSHGSLDNLKTGMNTIVKKYGKEVVVAENSYPYRFDDSDGHPDTFGDDRYVKFQSQMKWNVSPQGQAEQVRDVIATINSVSNHKGIGYFYWEPAWVSVGDTTDLTGNAWTEQYNKNKLLWSQYGCGWASQYSADYYETRSNASKYWGGSSWDNQAMFDASGTAMDSLNVFKYVYSGSTGNANTVTNYDEPKITLKVEKNLTEDDIWSQIWWNQIKCTYKDGTSGWINVRRWVNSECKNVIQAYQNNLGGIYTIHGILKDDENSVVSMKVTILSKPGTITSCKLGWTKGTYNGKTRTPGVTVTTKAGVKLKKNVDYTVSYPAKRKNVGTYTVKVTGINGYSNYSHKLTFTILPKATTIKSIKRGSKSFTITYKKKSAQITGYIVSYSTSKSFTKKKTYKKVYKAKSASTHKIRKLKSKKTYYVRMRTYKKVGKKIYHSAWTKVKKIKIK